jgi:MbtH protein
MDERDEDQTLYSVVVNHEEQYSIWPADQECPAGWTAVGRTDTKKECLTYIAEVWTDMRPLSVRKRMEATDASQTIDRTS